MTLMILIPGRDAISLDLISAARRCVVMLLVLPLLLGAAAQRCWGLAREALPSIAMGSLNRVANVNHHPSPATHAMPAQAPPVSAHQSAPVVAAARSQGLTGYRPESGSAAARAAASTMMTAVRPAAQPTALERFVLPLRAAATRTADRGALAALDGSAVISVKAIMQSLSAARRRVHKDVDPVTVPVNGVLRLQALHLGETLSARPFDDLLRPDPRAFLDINHLMRCRVTGEEVEMDPRLVGILSQLSSIYGRTLQLISGHRAPLAKGTSPTSQHTLGRAADIRIPGVRIEDLKKVVIKLGARGVGLYPEKGFVHIDVREKQRYYWQYTARGGEQADMGFTRPVRADRSGTGAEGEAAGEESDRGAMSAELAREAEHEAASEPEPAAEPDAEGEVAPAEEPAPQQDPAL
jgi:uncharacterized protein YcbK (DUF882 family)